ncbi:MAG: RIP metalloprotease RseP, partial [Opitutae bacterium]|nr:RIP metalloprotease RseP [Opitutae bacterium]
MEILTYAQALFLVIFFFGASIFVHELGHFLAALWRGLKVTRFSIGFGPRLWTWKREGIEYCISLLPIGGYVALPQLGHMEMIEGKAEEEIESKSISWTSKVIVLVAGAFFNVLFALLVASLLYLLGGRPVQATNDTTRIGFVPQSISIDGEILQNPAFSAGLRQGDIITAIDGEPVHRWEEVDLKVIMGSGKTRDDRPMSTFSLLRQGEAINVDIFPIIGGPERTRLVHLRPATPGIVGKLLKNSPAEGAEVMEGD